MHIKRNVAPKSWPIVRKGTTYVVRPNFNLNNGISILMILRDMLKIVQNRKEAKKAIHAKSILLNKKIVTDEKNTALLFDIITIVPSRKNYRLELLENGKFTLNEAGEKEAGRKISKIGKKKILKGKKVQINFNDGRNIISNAKCRIGDSAIIDTEKKKIEKILEMKEKANAVIFDGKHAGKKGVIERIDDEKGIAEIKTKDKKINALIKQIIVVE